MLTGHLGLLRVLPFLADVTPTTGRDPSLKISRAAPATLSVSPLNSTHRLSLSLSLSLSSMMSPYHFGSGPPPPPFTEPASSAPELDHLLAGAGYRVRSSDLRHVAKSLELLDSATLQSVIFPDGNPHYNPSDLAAWVDSMLSELSSSSSSSSPQGAPPPPSCSSTSSAASCTWTDPLQQQLLPIAVHFDEEDDGVRLVHLLVTCADAVQRGDTALAVSLLEEMRLLLVTSRVSTGFGIGKVAGYFVDALSRRLLYSHHPHPSSFTAAADSEVLYHHFYEACPYLKFAHFTANQAILEAFAAHDAVHLIDFNLMHGLQWPALIQALALRPGGPPFLRLTGIGPPSPDGRDSLREVGLRLAELARSVQVRFAFRGVAANRLDDVRPWMLQVSPGEAVAVNSVMQLHKLLGDPDAAAEPIEPVLSWIVGLRPKIVTVVEQEADHNKPTFLDRFTEALFYYSSVFDSLASNSRGIHHHQQQQDNHQSAALAEVYLQQEICNIVCCEGRSRVERHEPLEKWRARLSQVGLRPVHLGSNAFKQASMLLSLFSEEGYCVEEVDGCLRLGWHSRPLISASAWRARDDDVHEPPPESNVTISSRTHQDNASNNVSSSSSNNNNNNNNMQRL